MKDFETEFFLRKLELDYGDRKASGKLRKIAGEIDWLKGWPKEKKAFWNGEAFMWRNKISREKRELIRKELGFLERGRNLDLGCGSHSYVFSTGMDISEKMLLLNEDLKKRVVGDLEEKLPFRRGEFDSATLVLVLDYVKNYKSLLEEVFRVLKKGGQVAVVQARKEVNEWQRKQVLGRWGFKEVGKALEEAGFKVGFYKKEGLGFWKGRKG